MLWALCTPKSKGFSVVSGCPKLLEWEPQQLQTLCKQHFALSESIECFCWKGELQLLNSTPLQWMFFQTGTMHSWWAAYRSKKGQKLVLKRAYSCCLPEPIKGCPAVITKSRGWAAPSQGECQLAEKRGGGRIGRFHKASAQCSMLRRLSLTETLGYCLQEEQIAFKQSTSLISD